MNKFLTVLFFIALFCSPCFAIEDEFVEQTLTNQEIPAPETHLNYDYQSTKKVSVKLQVIDEFTSEKDIYEGQTIHFRVINNVFYKNKVVIRKDTIVPARVELIITPGMNGIPASVVLGGFKIDGVSYGQLTTSYEVFGQDRSLLVFPLKWALTPLPPTGSLTNFIMGGHAKLKKSKVITLYYHPEWR